MQLKQSSNPRAYWSSQAAWAAALDGNLTYNVDAAYNVSWDDAAWRLGSNVDGFPIYGYEGDPDNDGNYSYNYGYNLANSEMGHLFYEELGNSGYQNTDGTYNPNPGAPDYWLEETGNFNNLIANAYWSGTETGSSNAWSFDMGSGYLKRVFYHTARHGLAVRSGQVTTAPVPGPATMLLFVTGLAGIIRACRREKDN